MQSAWATFGIMHRLLVLLAVVALSGCGLIGSDDEETTTTTTTTTIASTTTLATIPAGAPNARPGAVIERNGVVFRTEVRTERREVAPGQVVEVPVFVEVPVTTQPSETTSTTHPTTTTSETTTTTTSSTTTTSTTSTTSTTTPTTLYRTPPTEPGQFGPQPEPEPWESGQP